MSSVDVVVPCYNYGRYLRDCVNSVLSQQGVSVRVLIIDDASTDDTHQVGAALAAEHTRVEYRRHNVNIGNIRTYNEGLMGWATAKYSLLISADDMLTPGSLQRATRVMEDNASVGFVYGKLHILRSGDALPDWTGCDDGDFTILPGHQWLGKLCRDNGVGLSSPELLVRTTTQHQIGPYRVDLPASGDIDVWARLAMVSDVGILNATQAVWRIHGKNMHLEDANGFHPLADLYNRRAAFCAAFDWYGDRLPTVHVLKNEALKALAKRSLWLAYKEMDGGRDKEKQCEFIRFAQETFGGLSALREYNTLRLRRRVGETVWNFIRTMKRAVANRGRAPFGKQL